MAPVRRLRPKTSPSLVDDGRSEEDGEGRGGAKYNMYSGTGEVGYGVPPSDEACV